MTKTPKLLYKHQLSILNPKLIHVLEFKMNAKMTLKLLHSLDPNKQLP